MRKVSRFDVYMPVLFLDCTKSAQVRIIYFFVYYLLPYFWKIQPKFSQKGKSIAPNTVNIFKSIGGRDIPKSKDLLFA